MLRKTQCSLLYIERDSRKNFRASIRGYQELPGKVKGYRRRESRDIRTTVPKEVVGDFAKEVLCAPHHKPLVPSWLSKIQ